MYLEDLLHHPLLPAFNLSLHLCFLWGVWRPYSSSSDHLHHPLDLLIVYSNAFTHTSHIHTYMYLNVSDNYLFVQNAVLKSMSMLYLSPSLCYIYSLCNFPTKMLTSVYNAHNNKNNNDKGTVGIAQLSLSAVLKIVL